MDRNGMISGYEWLYIVGLAILCWFLVAGVIVGSFAFWYWLFF